MREPQHAASTHEHDENCWIACPHPQPPVSSSANTGEHYDEQGYPGLAGLEAIVSERDPQVAATATGANPDGVANDAAIRELLPDDAPNRWVDLACAYCKPAAPCLMHDRRPRTLAQNRVIFGPSFGYEPTEADFEEAAFPWA